ncbi:MAG: hypothetical protein QOF02_176 [Blastocatellia bacterium]|jgi:hypothetical protein|nr:hypothetical protein [Blastocatellia bacterium]
MHEALCFNLSDGKAANAMNEILDLTPGLQCCLRCRRILTNRALHDSLEDSILASIRAAHADETDTGEVCQPCIEEYRNLLKDRETRSVRQSREEKPQRVSLIGKWLERRVSAA